MTFPNGATRTHKVSPAVANFSAARIGDTVSVGFEDQLTFVLSGSGTPTPRDRDRVGAAAVSTGRGVTGVGAAETIANWWVVGVDPNAGTLTLVDPNSGPVRTYKVATQAKGVNSQYLGSRSEQRCHNTHSRVISITPKGATLR